MGMNIRPFYILYLIVFLFLSCTSTKNTPSMRFFHALNTKYNVYFNGNESYKAGIKKINDQQKDDYTSLIPMYAISVHENAKTAESDFKRAIEKSRKAIKLHSIKTKPEFDPKKANRPGYKEWLQREEYNPALKEVWLLLAKSEFHTADFLGAVGTLSYVAKHYPYDPDIVHACQLWTVRAYKEMDWLYEAEDLLSKIDAKLLKGDNIGLYAAVQAELLLANHKYTEAIPFLEKTLAKEKDNYQELRFRFLLAQLYKKNGNLSSAYAAYSKVIQKNPPYIQEFNARIQRAELYQSSMKSIRAELNKMLKNPNNEEYLDQLYFTLAKTHLQEKDTLNALKNLRTATEESVRNGIEKAYALALMGDLYYERKDYVNAKTPYEEAAKIFKDGMDDYPRITKRVEILADLVVHHEVCVLQDSLQKLALLSESEQLEAIKGVIKRLEEEEKRQAQLAEKQAARAQKLAGKPVNPFEVTSNVRSGWYFYNTNLVTKGKTDFQAKWGKRKLEDHWRRKDKTSALFAQEQVLVDSLTLDSGTVTAHDSLPVPIEITDTKDPAYYLQQIPATPEQIAISNLLWSDALFQKAIVIKDKVEDIPLAIACFEEYLVRFSEYEYADDAMFQNYLLYHQQNLADKAEAYRNDILLKHPESRYAVLLQQPDFINRAKKMFAEQDSIYTITYKAYYANAFTTVKDQVAYVKENYPMSPLLPKFLFLKALSIGKTQDQQEFEIALNELVELFPQSEVTPMAKDIIALMLQGKEAKQGTAGTLMARREVDELQAGDSLFAFSDKKDQKHRLMLITPLVEESLNQLLYQVAVFNFSRFMVKDFDLLIDRIDSTYEVLSVTNLRDFDEAFNYQRVISADLKLKELIASTNTKTLVISEQNFDLLQTKKLGLEDYLAFVKNALPEQDFDTNTDLLKQLDQINLDISSATLPDNAPDAKTTKNAVAAKTENSSVKPVEKYKGLFLYDDKAPHQVVIYIQSGKPDVNAIIKAVENYSNENYPVLNLKVIEQKKGRMQLVVVQTFNDTWIASSFLQRLGQDPAFSKAVKSVNYRIFPGTVENVNLVLEKNEMSTYLEFLRLYYFK